MNSDNPACDWSGRTCRPCEGGVPPLPDDAVREALRSLPGWTFSNGGIEREFAFRNFHQTMAFVNAVAWVAHSQDHHPDLEVRYKSCRVRFSTHAAGGVTENDLICAARVEKLLAG